MINKLHFSKICFLALSGLMFCMMFIGTASAQVAISSFQAVPDTIDPGGNSTLVWATVDATSCTINGNAVGVNTSMLVSPANNTTYTLTCQGIGGPVSSNVIVKVRFIIQGKIKTPIGGNALANDKAVKYIRVIVMSLDVLGGNRELGRVNTDANGDFSVSFTDTTGPLDIYIDVEYAGLGVDGKFIEVRQVYTDPAPMKDLNLAVSLNVNPGRLNLGTIRVSSTRANIISQIGDAVRFLKNNYAAWAMPENINVEGRSTNGRSYVNGDGSFMSISLEDYNNPGDTDSAAFSDMHHETFHWVAFRTYGNRWPTPNCNINGHSFNTESCEGFAMQEGSAQYFGSSSAVHDNKTDRPEITDWRGADLTGFNNSGEIVEGALERSWYLSADLSGILKVILSKATDTMEEFRNAYAVEVGATSFNMQYFLSKSAENGIVYTRGRIDSLIPESAGTGNFKIINNVAFVRGKIKPQITLLTRAELKLGATSSRANANQKELGYKTAVMGLGGAIPSGFTFTTPVAFNTDLVWDTSLVADGEYDLLARTRSIYDWVDTFYPDFTGDGTSSVNTTEKWLKTQQTWYNQDNTPTTDDKGKVIVDNSIPTVSIQIKKTR